MLVLGGLFGAIHLDTVQTFLAKRLTSYFSAELKTHVHIDGVSIRFMKSVVLEGFYVEDQHGDTLIYSDELKISINDISTKNKSLHLKRYLWDIQLVGVVNSSTTSAVEP